MAVPIDCDADEFGDFASTQARHLAPRCLWKADLARVETRAAAHEKSAKLATPFLIRLGPEGFVFVRKHWDVLSAGGKSVWSLS